MTATKFRIVKRAVGRIFDRLQKGGSAMSASQWRKLYHDAELAKNVLDNTDAGDRNAERLRKLDLSKIGKFPLLVQAQGLGIYQSGSDNIGDYCGGAGTPPPVFNSDNLVVAECPKAEAIADALNEIWGYQMRGVAR